MGFHRQIEQYLKREIEIINSLDIDAINQVLGVLLETREYGENIYIFGNGGSAATASHFVCDFNKGASEALGGKKFKFHCLSDNIPTLMAIANDFSYDEIFRYQLQGVLQSEDIVIAISGSGNSRNVVNAVEYARQVGSKVIGLTGYDGGKVKQLADYSLHVPVQDMQITEDIHMILDHLMMKVLVMSEEMM